MGKNEETLDAVAQLVDEVKRLHMALTVQRSAYLLLVHHLSQQGRANPQTLLAGVEAMAQAQAEPEWQESHEQLAAELRELCSRPSTKRK